jgi:hypothetical protein
MNALLNASPPTDIWHDPVVLALTGVVATLLAGVIGAVLSFVIYRKQRVRREISYQVISDVPMVSVSKDLADKIDINFEEQRINNLRFLLIRIWNSGNIAVKPEDFDREIVFRVDGSKVLNGEVIGTSPKDLIDANSINLLIKSDSSSVELPKFLLKPEQSIDLKILYEGSKGIASVRGALFNGQITSSHIEKQVRAKYNFLLRAFFILPVIVGVISLSFFNQGFSLGLALVGLLLTAFAWLFTLAPSDSLKSSRSINREEI